MRPSSSPYANPSGLVDKRVGNMFSEIEQVRAALPQISHLSYYLESIFNLQRNLDLLSQQGVSHHILKDITIFQGASAYEIALANDFVGTEPEWLDSLIGPQGPVGLLDEVAHQELIDGIAANLASITATNLVVAGHTTALAGRLTVTAFNLYAAGIQDQLTQLEADILAAVPGLIPALDDSAVNNLAQQVFDASIVAVNNSIIDVNSLVGATNTLLDALRVDVDDNYATFNDFVFANNDTIGRVTALEVVTDDQAASIIEIATVSSDNATLLVTLQAESATHFASILSIESVQAGQATQINVLQVSNNANFAYIESVETVVVDGLAAAAVDRALIRTQFATADDDVLSSATALVTAEATARSTADSAAATDRAAIRAEFASADSGVLSAATALVATEASARSTADGATAGLITTLTANVSGRGTLNANSFFDEGPASSATVPPRWTDWTNGVAIASVAAKPWGGVGLHALMAALAGTPTNVGWKQDLGQGSARANTQYLLRAEIARGSGSLIASGVLVYWYNASDVFISSSQIKFGTEADTSGVVATTGDGRRVFEKLVTSPAAATRFVIFAQAAWNGFGETAQSTTPQIRWFECSLNVVDGATAQVSVVASAVADIEGNLLATYAISVDGGGAGALVSLEDGTAGPSSVLLSAAEIILDADAINFGADTQYEDTYNTFITVGGSYRYRDRGPFGAAGNLLIWYGPDSVALNSETVANSIFAITTAGNGFYGGSEILTVGNTASRAQIATGADNVSANSTWYTLALAAYTDVANPSVNKVPYVELVGQSQSSAVIGAGWQWRVVSAPTSNLSDIDVIKTGNFTMTAGGSLGGGLFDPPTVDTIDQPSLALVASTDFSAVTYMLQVQRTSGSATVGIQGILNIENLPS